MDFEIIPQNRAIAFSDGLLPVSEKILIVPASLKTHRSGASS
jgi:hypothetical protein